MTASDKKNIRTVLQEMVKKNRVHRFLKFDPDTYLRICNNELRIRIQEANGYGFGS
jgi:hypothetical protein